EGQVEIHCVTDDIRKAVQDPDVIFITTPANSHRYLAQLIGTHIEKETIIVLNPGRTFGILEFEKVYNQHNKNYKQLIAETQTTIHVSRKTKEDRVNIIALKLDVLIYGLREGISELVIHRLPECLREYLIP